MIGRLIGVALAGLLLASAASPAPAWAGGARVRVFVGAGPFWWGPGFLARPFWYGYPYYPGFYYPPAYGYPPVYGYPPAAYAPPALVQPSPPAYVQQQVPVGPPPPYYWYYCQDARAYYPYVKQCPRGWMKVQAPSGPAGAPGNQPDDAED
jgi:hypothetical protein